MMGRQSCLLLHGRLKHVPLTQNPWSWTQRIRDRNKGALLKKDNGREDCELGLGLH